MSTPFPTGTVTLNASSSGATTSLPFSNPQGNSGVRLYAVNGTVFYNFGKSGVQATVSCVPLPAGIIEIVDVGDANTMAIFTNNASATLYITPCMGGDL